MTLLSMAAKGGWLMIVLLIISIIAIAIIVERLMKMKKAVMPSDKFLQAIKSFVANKQYDKALQLCEQQADNPAAVVIGREIDAFMVSPEITEQVINSIIRHEVYKLEKNLGTLASIAAIAPLVGFLGTVTGMVKVFMNIAETGGGVDITLLASGIWEALLTTIGGLAVGIIAILFYNYLVGKIEDYTKDIESIANQLLLDFRRKKDGTQ